MKKEQFEALMNLSVWQRKIGFAQRVLEGMDSPAVEKAINELQDVSVSMYGFMTDLIEKGGDIK
jgi:hypothetical protein